MVVHWELCRKYKLPAKEKWYEHQPDKVLENNTVKPLWDFKIKTDRVLEHINRGILIVEKGKETCVVIDIACPFHTRIKEKENEKINKCQDLKRKIRKVWKCKEVVIVAINYYRTSGNCEFKLTLWLKSWIIALILYRKLVSWDRQG